MGKEFERVGPLVYDYSWSKQELYDRALTHAKTALNFWGLPAPRKFHSYSRGFRRHGSGGTLFGLYHNQEVYVNVERSTQPPRKRGRVWSYPGNKSDRTAAGILCHEVGHHVAWCLYHGPTALHRPYNPNLAENWKRLCHKSFAITGYEPTPEEAFAETFRLFLLNPDLLRLAIPERYLFLVSPISGLGLNPPHEFSWCCVMRNAPKFITENIKRWLDKRSRKRYPSTGLLR